MITKDNFMLCNGITENKVNETLDTYENGFVAEFKEDGERIIAVVLDGDTILINRNGKICNIHFNEIVEQLKVLPNCIIDGEIISKDGDFTKLQKRALTKTPSKIKQLESEIPIDYVVFDIIKIEDTDLRYRGLLDRKEKLNELFAGKEFKDVKLIEFGSIKTMLDKAHELDKEGIILKNKDSFYEGRRSDNWLKLKFWCEEDITFTKYSINPNGIRVETNDGKVAVQVGGKLQSEEVKQVLDMKGEITITIQYLEKFLNEGNYYSYRFPTYKKVVYPNENNKL